MVKKTTSVKAKPAAREEDSHSLVWEAGKFCLDIAKLILAGVVLAGLMKQDLNFALLCIIGTIVMICFAGLGFYFLTRK